MLGEDAPGAVPAVGALVTGEEGTNIYAEPRRLLASVYGPGMLAGILAKARADLIHRLRLLLDEEMVRFVEVIELAGPCDDVPRPSGCTRRNTRSRRSGDSEHDRRDRTGAFAPARQAGLPHGADPDRGRKNRI